MNDGIDVPKIPSLTFAIHSVFLTDCWHFNANKKTDIAAFSSYCNHANQFCSFREILFKYHRKAAMASSSKVYMSSHQIAITQMLLWIICWKKIQKIRFLNIIIFLTIDFSEFRLGLYLSRTSLAMYCLNDFVSCLWYE